MRKKLIVLATAMFLSTVPIGDYTSVEAKESQITRKITSQENIRTSLEEQLKMLELSIIPDTPEETVNLWAKAVKNRNGALQYALGTENVKMSLKPSFEQFHWVTGASSPWVETYRIVKKEEQNNSIKFLVELDLYTSIGEAGKDQAELTVVEKDGKWFIASIAPANEKAVGIWNTPESINELNATFEKLQTVKSKLGYEVQLPNEMLNKIKIEDSTCKNEEGNPPCTFYYYKDTKAKKDVLLLTTLQLTKKQEQSDYYKEHPFLKKLGSNKNYSYYTVSSSELPYANNAESVEASEWNNLYTKLVERLKHFNPTIE